jgi:hypothetical protein
MVELYLYFLAWRLISTGTVFRVLRFKTLQLMRKCSWLDQIIIIIIIMDLQFTSLCCA